mmetsp:Transcript_8066/g.15255  ORF Transcript_8066/g.15255 Transcript_8066/m.15255 type:complete len:644 (-) Transcript_8066:844-2775(-)
MENETVEPLLKQLLHHTGGTAGAEDVPPSDLAPLSLGDLDLTSEEVELDGLVQELELWGDHEVVRGILCKGTDVRKHVREVDARLRAVELDSIQDYIQESDNLMHLHQQMGVCDDILGSMEELLGGFQADLGNISTEIKTLQEQSLGMSVKLNNRKLAEAELGSFVEKITVPPALVTDILDAEVNEAYLQYLVALQDKLKFCAGDPLVHKAAALQDVEPELERLRVKAVGRVRDFMLAKFNLLQKPRTNFQILQQSVLLKYKTFMSFLADHGQEVFPEVRRAYVATMSGIYHNAIKYYQSALSRIQNEVAARNDLIGSSSSEEMSVSGLFARAREAIRTRDSVFALGGREAVLTHLDQMPPFTINVITSMSQSGTRHPYEVLFRSLNKLLIDNACAEYLFCEEFWREDHSIFRDIFEATVTTLQEALDSHLASYYDVIGLLLMIRINYEHQLIMQKRCVPCLDTYIDKVNLLLWPRLKAVADMHINSLRNGNSRSLWSEDVHAHYVARKYAEFTASMLTLNADYGEAQIDHILERLRTAACELLVRIAGLYSSPRSQCVFLINSYDLVLTVLKEAGVGGAEGTPDRCGTARVFEDLLGVQMHAFVEEELSCHFGPFVAFIKKAEAAMAKSAATSHAYANRGIP